MIYIRQEGIDWDAFTATIKVGDLASTCDAKFLFTPDEDQDYENYCYVFKTEHENLFMYTTSAFAGSNVERIATLSILLYEEDTKQTWYRHQFDEHQNWRRMESPADWQPTIDKFMLEYKINAMLREST